MTPPRASDVAPAAARDAAYDAIVDELAQLQGVINVASGRQVELTRQALELGVSGGDHLTSERWIEWRTGASPARAADVVRVAKRADELPVCVTALAAGELSLEQVAEVARYVPARYDRSAAVVAQCCTVRQLRQALPWYRDPKPPKPGADPDADGVRTVSTGTDERGWWIRGRLPEAEGAVVDQALKAMREDLRRQARAEAPEGEQPRRVSAADALVALAETALRAGEAARPGTDRYLVHVHLEAGPAGAQLATHLGIVLPEGQRRQILCDARLRATFHAADGAPLSTGRTTRDISRRMRRAIEHRDGHSCGAPGCGRTTDLQIHHIWHWEDGGPTDTWNLITLCPYHHTLHHQGVLGISGNADLPRHVAPGVTFADARGRPLPPVGLPVPPASAASEASPAERLDGGAAALGLAPHRYQPPVGERLDRGGFHLQEAPPAAGGTPEGEEPAPPEATPRPRPDHPQARTGLDGHAGSDPTRAGPTAA